MKENAIIINGERFDFVAVHGMTQASACQKCALAGVCWDEQDAKICRIYKYGGRFVSTLSLEELNRLLRGKVLYRDGKKLGTVIRVGRDTDIREPYIYCLCLPDDRFDFYYSDLEKMMRGEKYIYRRKDDSCKNKFVYELKGGDE